jgi:hypothetical protein
MAGVARIPRSRVPRSRGGLCGTLLLLLGAWGALIPFVGPYFHYAYSPDRTWAYTSGRLYLSIIPGAAALLGGLAVLLTRSRAVGMLGGLLAALGGAWFIVGAQIVQVVLKKTSISAGAPIGPPAAGASPLTTRMFLEQLGFFAGLGIVVIFIAAIVIGRFSMLAAKDAAVGTDSDYGSGISGYGGGASDYGSLAAGDPASQQFPSSQQDALTGQQDVTVTASTFPPSPSDSDTPGPLQGSRSPFPPSQFPPSS